jgi:hypothetical protein
MFERFTDRSHGVLVLAQQEALLLNHGFIGTEHILLGLIHEGEGIAAQALALLGITLEDVRRDVEETIGLSGSRRVGSPPFTPRAKKVLELSYRESLELGHDYIGTEHLLLGLLREGKGVAAEVLMSLGAGLEKTRAQVLVLLGLPADTPRTGPAPLRFRREISPPSRLGENVAMGIRRGRGIGTCSFCGRQPPETGQLFTRDDASICEHCVRRWSEQLGEYEGIEGE